MAISKQNRALIVITNLEPDTPGRWNELYHFMDVAGDNLAHHLLGSKYIHVKRLVGNNATASNFITTLQTFGSNQAIKRIDVIINLHGNPNKLHFHGGALTINDLRTRIQGLHIGGKLRMLYSTACFGAKHAPKFIQAGFDVAAGAKGVNANSAAEYPVVLTMWSTNFKFHNCISGGENPLTRLPADTIARGMGFNGVNSDKDIFGNGNIKINS